MERPDLDIPASPAMKVLVVDDDPDIRGLLSSMISVDGFSVIEVADGKAAWQCLQEEDIPIVLTDWLMPEMDGMELIRAIRAREDQPYSYIIMLTGASDANVFSRGMEAGADDLLTKPWRTEELFGRLNVARRIMRLQQQLAQTNRTLRASNQELEFFHNRVQRELEEASRLQRSLLPTKLIEVPGLAIEWSMLSCEELAGDVLNVLLLDDDHVGLYVLDVSGHGVSAALLSVQLSRLLQPEVGQSQLLRRPNGKPDEVAIQRPTTVMQELNQLFQMSPSRPQFFTLLYGVLDVGQRRFSFSSAGHPGPIHVSNGGEPRAIEVAGTPLGMLPTGSWNDIQLQMQPCDRLALISDGLLEAMNSKGEMFGDRRIMEILRSSRSLSLTGCCQAVMDGVRNWCGNQSLQDDCSLLMIEVE